MFRNLIVTLVIFLGNVSHALAYERIVSMLPSSTEMLYMVGAGDQVIGVTRYCKFPPEAQEKTIVGGLLDINFEVVYGLNPDLIIIQDKDGDKVAMFKKMGIEVLEIETRTVKGILEAIQLIGEATDNADKAQEIVQKIEQRIKNIEDKVEALDKPMVVVTFLRPLGEGNIREVYIAGNHTYFDDLINIVGGKNAYQGSQLVTSPVVSAEGVMSMNPDVIVELMGTLNEVGITKEQALKDWDVLKELDAYKNGRIHLIDKSYAGIPGPRITEALDDLVRFVHPEIDWDKE